MLVILPIPVPLTQELQSAIHSLHTHLNTHLSPLVGGSTFHSTALDELHVSLSRTVAIRHHWIDPLTEALREKLGRRKR